MNEEKGMIIIVDLIGVFREKVTDDLTSQHIKRRRYETIDTEDIPFVLSQTAQRQRVLNFN